MHQLKEEMLYIIEGNAVRRRKGFSYVMSHMDKLLGFDHVLDKQINSQ